MLLEVRIEVVLGGGIQDASGMQIMFYFWIRVLITEVHSVYKSHLTIY